MAERYMQHLDALAQYFEDHPETAKQGQFMMQSEMQECIENPQSSVSQWWVENIKHATTPETKAEHYLGVGITPVEVTPDNIMDVDNRGLASDWLKWMAWWSNPDALSLDEVVNETVRCIEEKCDEWQEAHPEWQGNGFFAKIRVGRELREGY